MLIDRRPSFALRTRATVVAVFVLAALPAWPGAPAASATGGTGARPATTVPIPTPKAWILVDAGSGAVLDAGNERQPLPPASLTKLLTAVVAAQTLQPTDVLTVSARAAGEPARKIGMKAGEVWPLRDALYCLLLSSANDAAAAIGERVGGNLETFATMMTAAGRQLGLSDSPVLEDPAGLDDSVFSVDGGNLLSARDVAIIMRAALAQPTVAAVMATNIYAFVGPDGFHHRLTNHIHSFLTGYPGAVGGKPGFTTKAGSTLVLAARRSGRTLISVVLGAPDPYGSGMGLLDRGFAMPADTLGTGDVLPEVRLPAPAGTSTAVAAATPRLAAPSLAAVGAAVHHNRSLDLLTLVALVITCLLFALLARRRQIQRRRYRRLSQRMNLPAGVAPLRRTERRGRAASPVGGAIQR